MDRTPHDLRLTVHVQDPPDDLVAALAARARVSRPTPSRSRRTAAVVAGAVGTAGLAVGGAWATGAVTVPGLPAPPGDRPRDDPAPTGTTTDSPTGAGDSPSSTPTDSPEPGGPGEATPTPRRTPQGGGSRGPGTVATVPSPAPSDLSTAPTVPAVPTPTAPPGQPNPPGSTPEDGPTATPGSPGESASPLDPGKPGKPGNSGSPGNSGGADGDGRGQGQGGGRPDDPGRSSSAPGRSVQESAEEMPGRSRASRGAGRDG